MKTYKMGSIFHYCNDFYILSKIDSEHCIFISLKDGSRYDEPFYCASNYVTMEEISYELEIGFEYVDGTVIVKPRVPKRKNKTKLIYD